MLRVSLVVLVMAVAGSACQRVPEPHPPGYRTPLEPFAPAVPEPWRNARAGLQADPSLRSVNVALDDLLERSDDLAEPVTDAPAGIFAEVERLFVQMGRLGELLDLYRARVAAEGPGSTWAPRLAIFYTLLGYRAEARALLDGALDASAGNAEVESAAAIWLLGGPSPSEDDRLEAARHLQRAAEATPGFGGIFTYDPGWVERTLATLPTPE